jgi:hypothetical protein
MVRSFLWNGRMPYGTSSSRQCHHPFDRQVNARIHREGRTPSEQHYSDPLPGGVMRSMIPRGASFARAAEPGVGHQSQDRGEVAQARDGRGYEDWSFGATIHRADRGGGGDGRGIAAPYAAAIGRFPLRPAAVHPPPDAICAAPLPAAAWHLAVA